MMRFARIMLRISGYLAIAAVVAAGAYFCKGKESPEISTITADSLADVLGRADGSRSGLVDMSKSGDEIRLTYLLYVPDRSMLDQLIGAEIAPKIRELYGKYKGIDRVVFSVETALTGSVPPGVPYCSFVMTRDVFNKTNWSGLLDRDLFKICRDVTYR
jgi:hypothetical protein